MDQYKALSQALQKAFLRAAKGKGAQRHGDDRPFEQQDLCEELRALGYALASYQIRKKAKELLRLSPRARSNEALDIIVYAAAIVIVSAREVEDEDKRSETEGSEV
jgi:phage terminase large subunit GpA-like protein